MELELSADQDLPDVLVYWSPSTPQSAVDDGWLLGVAPDARRFDYRLPAGAPEARGRVVLYSLGHHQVVASVELRWP